MRKRNFILLSLSFMVLFLNFISNAFCRENSNRPGNKIPDRHISIIGFGGSIRHFSGYFGSTNAYGTGIFFNITEKLGIQLEYTYSSEDNSWNSIADRSDGNFTHSDFSAVFKCHTYNGTAILSPFREYHEIKPYFKIGISLNDYTIHSKYSEKIKDEEGKVVDKSETVYIPESMDKNRYRTGFVLSSGIIVAPNRRFSPFLEMLYNSVKSDWYRGGVYFNGGICFKIF